jgi:predicted O-methyltransferase YrrM
MTSHEQWAKVDRYISQLFGLSDPALISTLRRSREKGLPEIEISYPQGQLLYLLSKAAGARRILEIGTLGGFSTIFLARALPENGILYALELDSTHAAVARENIASAGLDTVVRILEGDASKSLATMISETWDPFDLIFIDADKPGYPSYLEAVLRLSRQGTVIVADNVVRGGAVLDPDSDDPDVRGVREFNALLAADPRVGGTILQTVGSKGHDGFAIAVVAE